MRKKGDETSRCKQMREEKKGLVPKSGKILGLNLSAEWEKQRIQRRDTKGNTGERVFVACHAGFQPERSGGQKRVHSKL